MSYGEERARKINESRGKRNDKQPVSLEEKLSRLEQTKEHYRKKLSEARRGEELANILYETSRQTGELTHDAKRFVKTMRSAMPSVLCNWLDSDILTAYQNITNPNVVGSETFDVDAFWGKLLQYALHGDAMFEDGEFNGPLADGCKCEHKNWVIAGYPRGEFNLHCSNIYEVYCKDCGNFVNLMSREIINDKGLVRMGV